MTRRLLLQGLLLSLWSGVAEAAPRLTGRLRAGGRGFARAANQPAPEAPTLSASELATLLAFGEVLVEGRIMSAAERCYLAEHIEDSAKHLAEQRVQYRRAVRLLDRLAGKPFSSLEITDRIQLLGRHRLDARTGPTGDDPEPLGGELRMIRARVVPDLIEGYWGSPAGWAAVGYGTFPGRCGNLTRYTRSEA